MKILVVDDDQDVRDLATAMLQREGHEVILAMDGEEGEIAAVNELPDLIFLDVMMPVKDGYAVLKFLREDARTSHIPVIMLSAVDQFELGKDHSPRGIGTRASTRPPELFVAKPIVPGLLCEAVRQISEESQ